MTSFKDCLLQQAALHPAMQPQDAVKLCFQAAFGAEHLLGNAEEAFRWLKAEWDAVLPSGIQLWEHISEHLARVNLAAWKQAGHALEDLFRLFLDCAMRSRPLKQMPLLQGLPRCSG